MATFDLHKTQRLSQLFAVPQPQRNEAWVAELMANVADASLAARERQTFGGPDGFLYFALYLPPTGQSFEPFSVSHVLEHCTDQGLGVAINPDKQQPDWVIPYGSLWSLRQYGRFDGDGSPEAPPSQPQAQVVQEDRQVLVGAPDESLVPAFARAVLRRHLLDKLFVPEPKVALVLDPSRTPSRSLVFNVFPEQFPNESIFQQTFSRLSWFLPAHVGLIATTRDSDLARSAIYPL